MKYIDNIYKLIDNVFVDEFVILVNINCKPLRTPKYSTIYYLYNILLILTDLQSWKSLKLLYIDKPVTHYKTIQDKHLQWSKLNLYEKTYKIVNEKYHQQTLKKSSNLTLFIDSTNIYNKNGQSNIGYGQNPKNQESRISAICDINKNIYSLTLIKSNIKGNTKRKTFPNDSKTVISSIVNLLETNIKYRNINLVGDKGYATKLTEKIQLQKDYKINLIYPHKKNQKIKTHAKHKKLLKHRYVIEIVFAKLKSYDRICCRKDKLECTFMGFAYLAAMLIFKK
jgi:transposase